MWNGRPVVWDGGLGTHCSGKQPQEALYTAFVMPDSLTDNAITYATSSFEFFSATGLPEV